MAISNESNFSLNSYIEQRRQKHSEGLPMPESPVIDLRFLTRTRGITYSLKAVGMTSRGQLAGLTTTFRIRRSRAGALIETLAWLPYVYRGGLEDQLFTGFDDEHGPQPQILMF